MPRHDGKHATINAAGEITEIFAHRFVLKTLSRNVLADLTPHGLEIVTLRVGDKVSIEGEQNPSEIKVSKLERNGETFEIAHGPHDKHAHAPADPVVVIEAAKSAG